MQQLNRKNFFAPKKYPLKILQFGGGNFLRAFVDWMVQKLNTEADFNGGVVIVKPTPGGDYEMMRQQDGLFTVILNGSKNNAPVSEKIRVDCVQEIVNPYTQWEYYLDLAQNPDLRFIVSNTTEAGIQFNPEDRYKDAPPQGFPAKLTLWLYQRFLHFKGDPDKGCLVLPCELIPGNGEALKKTVLDYAHLWDLDPAFEVWIHAANYFYNTLVDRIVSGFPSDIAHELEQELAYVDKLMVTGEYYHQWVISGHDILQREIPFARTKLNVKFVDDLAPYRQMKVRILNGAHTALVPVGYLAGLRFVHEAMEDATVFKFVEKLLRTEVAPILPFADLEKNEFINDVLERFKNPVLKHRLGSIALNSTSKFMTRLYPTLTGYLALYGKLPNFIVFGLAALLCYYRGTLNGQPISLNDNPKTLLYFKKIWQDFEEGAPDFHKLTQALLENPAIWGADIAQVEGLVTQVAHYLKNIVDEGMRVSLKSLLF